MLWRFGGQPDPAPLPEDYEPGGLSTGWLALVLLGIVVLVVWANHRDSKKR
jgi:hypothetical protein